MDILTTFWIHSVEMVLLVLIYIMLFEFIFKKMLLNFTIILKLIRHKIWYYWKGLWNTSKIFNFIKP